MRMEESVEAAEFTLVHGYIGYIPILNDYNIL